MSHLNGAMATFTALLFTLLAASVSAATPEECKTAVDEVSVGGPTNYDSALEAELTQYLEAANDYLMQKDDASKALKELASYEQKLDNGIKAKKISAKDAETLKANLNKAMQCVRSLKQAMEESGY